MSPEKIKQFQKQILDWYAKNKRDLPWRKTRAPYNILISEVMSQQTQINRIIPKYEAWLKAFPTIMDLAQASTRDVLLHWSGLGYNRRALYLQKCAQTIVTKYNGQFPEDEKKLLALPGIGKYTARALLCFAFDRQIAVVDTNIRKVILIQFGLKDLSENNLEEIATQLLPKGQAYEWNQALMDYASSELKKEKIPRLLSPARSNGGQAIPKQSHFLTSDRYYRGQIIKLLIKMHEASWEDIQTFFSEQGKTIEISRLRTILATMKKDQLIQQHASGKYFL